jgi:UPF0755 protein
MSQGYDGWDSPPRGRDTDSGRRSHRRRGSGRDDEYGADGYAEQGDYGSGQYAGAGGDYQGGYAQDGYGQGGYAQDGYADNGYAGQGYDGRGYENGSYGGDTYAARDPYAADDAYQAGGYGPADAYPDPRASGPYDTGASGYAAQDGFGGHDPYASQGGYDRGGYAEQDSDLYRWRDPQDAGDDPGLTRRRGSGEGGFDAEDPRHDGFFRGFGGSDDDFGGRGGGRGRPQPPSRGRPPKQKKSKAGLVALLVVLAIFAGVGYTGFHYYSLYKSRHAVYTGSGYGSAIILVRSGDTLDGISAQLLDKHVIAAIDPWASYVANKSGLHPGKYKIHIHMSPAAAYAALINQKNLLNSKVTIIDGKRLSLILPTLASESGIPLSQFETASKDISALGLPPYAHGQLEGYLYPDTYDVAPGETALQILRAAVKEFNTQMLSIHMQAQATSVHFTPAQVITGASLLEGEVGPKYFADVARVIDNRLNQGMNLGLDSTIAYATGKPTFNLTQTDLNVNSPYNTRLHAGLPPGPINSPDIAAIQAFLHPAPKTNTWIYFVTVDKAGTTNFTSDYNQFLTWSAEAKRNGLG